MNETEQLIQEQLKRLPPELRKAIEAVPWKALVTEIANTNTLSPEQSSTLEKETMLIIYGFEPPQNYIDNLIRELKVEEDAAITITEAINEKIFGEIKRESGRGANGNLPAVEGGEKAHDVTHDKTLDAMPKPALQPAPTPTPGPVAPPQTSVKTRPHSDTSVDKVSLTTPDYRYPGGADPYREPLK